MNLALRMHRARKALNFPVERSQRLLEKKKLETPRLEESCAWLTCQRSSGARSGPSTARTSTPCACELRHPSPSTLLPPQVAARDALRSMCRCAARQRPRPPPRQASHHMCPRTPHAACHERCTWHEASHGQSKLPAQPTPSRACTPSLHPSACERQALDVRSADMRALFDGRCLELLAPTF